jgi:hypothetical protein
MHKVFERSQADPFSLDDIKNTVVLKALSAPGGSLYQAMRTFFMRMHLLWSDTAETAEARRLDDIVVIALGRRFFAEHVHSVDHAADVVWHELIHPILGHLSAGATLLEQGCNEKIFHIAIDAMNNAVLHSINCAGFMEQYYSDSGVNAFLRPNSYLVKTANSKKNRKSDVTRRWQQECSVFYQSLYALRVTLEETIKFLAEHFNVVTIQVLCLGDHSWRKPDGERVSGQGDESDEHGIFRGEELQAIRKVLKIEKIYRNNFNAVIRKVSEGLSTPGMFRTGREVSRRMPALLSKRDMINIEIGRNRFVRPDYRLRRVRLLIDVSGSMTDYIPFMVGLVISLSQREFLVEVVCWADRPIKVSFEDLKRGAIPAETGGGTQGEALARYIQEYKLQRVVIITDNYAGTLATLITSQVELCLIEGADVPGTFDNKVKVPHCTVHRLQLKIPA